MTSPKDKKWMRKVLVLAGIYNLTFGLFCVLLPNFFFELIDADVPKYPFLWQCIGMIVGVYGVGYIAASKSPLRHWPIILVGLLGKIFGPIGFVQTAIMGDIPWAFGYLIITNDLIWIIPFIYILIASYRKHCQSD